MNFINIYMKVLKNNQNYNIILYNLQYNIMIILNINYNLYFKLNYNIYIKIIKNYFLENGFKILLLENWYKFGIKYNLILKLLS